MNILKLNNIKGISELNSKETIRIEKGHEKVSVQNENLRAENSELKTQIKTLKIENIGLKYQNIYLNNNRIGQSYKCENGQIKQKSIIQNLKDIAQIEQSDNNLLM